MGFLQRDFIITTTRIQIINSTVTLFVEHTASTCNVSNVCTLSYGVDVLPLFNMSYLASIGSWTATDRATIRKHHRQDAYKSSKFRSVFEMPKIVWPPRCVADDEDISLHKQLSRHPWIEDSVHCLSVGKITVIPPPPENRFVFIASIGKLRNQWPPFGEPYIPSGNILTFTLCHQLHRHR